MSVIRSFARMSAKFTNQHLVMPKSQHECMAVGDGRGHNIHFQYPVPGQYLNPASIICHTSIRVAGSVVSVR
jgi:hypothetical protein